MYPKIRDKNQKLLLEDAKNFCNIMDNFHRQTNESNIETLKKNPNSQLNTSDQKFINTVEPLFVELVSSVNNF